MKLLEATHEKENWEENWYYWLEGRCGEELSTNERPSWNFKATGGRKFNKIGRN